MKAGDKISKWLFVHDKSNKKEPTLFDAYCSLIVPWMNITLWFMLGVFILLAPTMKEFTRTTFNYVLAIGGGLFMIAASIWFGYIEVQDEKKKGFSQLLKDFVVKRWHEKRKKYGLEE